MACGGSVSFRRTWGWRRTSSPSRLKLLVESGLLMTQPASDGSAYKEYVLTEKRAVGVSGGGWLEAVGERYLFEAGEARSELVEGVTGQALETLQVRAVDGRVLGGRGLPAQGCAAWVIFRAAAQPIATQGRSHSDSKSIGFTRSL